jgi:hypothetical protein
VRRLVAAVGHQAAVWLAFGVGLATIVIVAVEVNVVH